MIMIIIINVGILILIKINIISLFTITRIMYYYWLYHSFIIIGCITAFS